MTRWLFIFLLCALSPGCTRNVYVPVESVRTEYRDREVERVSTDTLRDTRILYIKGDTVVDLIARERISYVERHDTMLIERTDTVAVPYPVGRELTRWEQAKMDMGGIALGVCLCAVVAAVIWLVRMMRRR